jgi:HK97 family phage portal protein
MTMAKRRNKQRVNNAAVPSSSVVRGSDGYSMFAIPNNAGVPVTESTVMNVSAVYACIQLISGAMASLPLPIYERTKTGRQRVDHPLWWLLNEQPLPRCSASTFWRYMMTSKLLHGDGFALIKRKSAFSPEIVSITPWHPLAVNVYLNGDRLAYQFINYIGGQGIESQMYDQDDVLHFTGVGFNGLRSVSPLRHALRNAAGIALAADKYSAEFFSASAKPEIVIKTEMAKLSGDQKELIIDAWKSIQQGDRTRPGVLGAGMSLQELTINAEEAQLLQSRMFQIEDIARIYGVPPFMIGHTQNTTSWGSGVEQMGIGFVKYTLSQHIVDAEQEINRKLFLTEKNFCEFNTAGLERGDIKTRNESYRIGLGRAGEPAWLTVNEVRAAENLPPKEGGDVLFVSTAPTGGAF